MRLVRDALALIAVAALAAGLWLALFAPHPAQAQTSSTLISNTGQTDAELLPLTVDMAQSFTTGSNAAGYRVTSVEIEGDITSSGTTPPTFTVAIHTGSGTSVGASVGSLTSSGFVDGTNSFTSSSGIDLDANTSYFVVLDVTSPGDRSPLIRSTSSQAEDTGGSAGWSMGNRGITRASDTSAWTDFGTARVLEMNIKGSLAPLGLTVSSSSLLESADATNVTVTATVGTASTSARTVTLAVDSTSTATNGTDYATLTPGSITIAANQTSGTATVSIDPTQDIVDEGTGETIVITGSASGFAPGKATVTITDDDDAPTVINLSTTPASLDEDDSDTAVTVTATFVGTTRTVDTVVMLDSTLGGSATGGGTDYSHSDLPSSVTISAESSSGSATGLMIDPAEDTIDEGTKETIVINGSSAGLTVNGATVDLDDNDDPEITLSSTRVGAGAAGSVDEGDSATFRISAARNTADKSAALSVPLALVTSGVGASTATSGTDFTALTPGTITIPIGSADASRNVTINTTEDRLDEGTGETIVLGATVSGFTVNHVTITINDDDAASTDITLTVSGVSDDGIGEGDTSNTTVTVTATVDDAAPTSDVTVALSLAGSAVSGTDYVANPEADTPGTLDSITISALQVEGSATFVIDPTDDSIDEDDETITVNGSATGGLTATDSVNITLTDNDTAALTLFAGGINEGDGATSTTINATLDIERSKNTTVALALSGTAVKGTDYTVPATLPSITIAAGSKMGSTSLSITPIDDRLDEGLSETITVTGSADGVTGDSVDLTLVDNDATSTAVTVTLVDPDDDSALTSIGEGDGATSVKIVATLNDAAVKTATDMAIVSAGTAEATTDYSFTPTSPPPKVTFNPGEHEASFTISVNPVNDLIDEGAKETIIVGVQSTLAVTTATLDLTDDDTASSVTITLDESNVREADADDQGTQVNDPTPTTVEVTATIDDSITRLVNTDVAVALSGSATSADYSVSALPTITIVAGGSSATGQITITPLHDTVTEGDETITVGGSATGLTINTADITLSDDDSPSTSLTIFILPAAQMTEASGATDVEVRAILDGGTLNSALTVDLTLDGTATKDTDYTLGTTLPDITVAANKPQGEVTISIDPIEDTIDEGTDEDITIGGTVTLSGFTVRPGSFSYQDNDTVSKRITLTVDRDSVDENANSGSSVAVTATLAGSVTRSVPTEVDLFFGGSATQNTDYTATPANPKVTIPAEASTSTTAANIMITPIDDSLREGSETIAVRGSVDGFNVRKADITLNDDEWVPPSKITDLAATVSLTSANTVHLEWTAPQPGPITQYRLQQRTRNGVWRNAGNPPTGGTSHSINNLDYGTEYLWVLYASNAAGEGVVSNVATVTTGPAPQQPRPTGGGPVGGGPAGGGGGGGEAPTGPPPGLSVLEPLSRTPSFSDVPSGSVLGPGIQRAARLGIMPGTDNGGFEPDLSVTRLDAAAPMVRLWQALGGTCPRATRTPFRDLPARGGVRVDIACLHAEGIVAGTGAVTYSPDRVLNRAQMMTLMARMWRLRGNECPSEPPNPFADVSDGHYHRPDILCMYALGVTRGTGPDTFSPDQQLTRAEVAVFAARFYDAAPNG